MTKSPVSIWTDRKGVAMIVVIVVVMLLTLVGSFVANLGYNQQKLVSVSSGKRVQTYYRAQAGTVHACWKIRANQGGVFSNPAYTESYSLDVDEDGNDDCDVSIGAFGAVRPKAREIRCTGRDN